MAYGYRAAFVTLAIYLSRSWNTIEKIISRWAPSSENNTDNYIKNVEKYSGVPRNKELTVADGALHYDCRHNEFRRKRTECLYFSS